MKRITIEFEIDNEQLEDLHKACDSVEKYTVHIKNLLLVSLQFDHDHDIEYLAEELLEDKREYSL